jgi:hypothetical protein
MGVKTEGAGDLSSSLVLFGVIFPPPMVPLDPCFLQSDRGLVLVIVHISCEL